MSDLQCAATLYVPEPDAAGDIVEALTAKAVVLVYACRATRCRAFDLATGLNLQVRLDPLLDSPDAAAATRAFEGIADLHRGEVVAVLPRHPTPRCSGTAITVIRIDDDGWSYGALDSCAPTTPVADSRRGSPAASR